MSKYSRTHLSDGALLQGLKEHVAHERGVTHKSKAEIEQLLAERFSRMDVPAQMLEMSSSLSPGIVNGHNSGTC